MAHGSKKWIVRYDGRIKRSRHRTRLDYYGELEWWDYQTEKSSNKQFKGWRAKRAKYCPQCRYVQKQTPREESSPTHWEGQQRIRDEWCLLRNRSWVPWRHSKYPGEEKAYADWVLFRERHPLNKIPVPWMCYDDRTFLCFKCTRKLEVKKMMWKNVPGWKARYQGTVEQDRKDYRAYVRRMMQQERYDEIDPRRRGWLD